MRSLIIAFALLIAISGAIFWNSNFNTKFTKYVTSEISEINTIIFGGNLKSAEDKFNEIDRYLEKNKTIIRSTANHHDFMVFDESYVKLKAYFRQRDYENYTIEYANVMRIIKHIYDSERMNWGNIL